LHVAVVVDAAFSQRDHVVAYRGHGDPALHTEGVRSEQLRAYRLQAAATYPCDRHPMTPGRPTVITTTNPATRRTHTRGGSRHQLGS
jgi:membrane-bound lytic murein transglycosylase